MGAGSTRLDVALVQQGFYPSRQRAQAAIRAGLVSVNGRVVTRPSFPVTPADRLEAAGDPIGYVSRGGLKLAAALDRFGVSPAGRVCLDVGASTGGFTQVLLERGARRVYAVDVGRGQLHPDLARDPRVVSLEETDVRTLTALPGEPPDLVTCDVSFISLTLVLPHLVRLAPGAEQILLVKPQFEVGRSGVGKGGIVRDPRRREEAVARVLTAAAALGLVSGGVVPSPILGGDGNQEFLLYLRPGAAPATRPAGEAAPPGGGGPRPN
ncbi:MAG: TlyA family RNA methyltransferase [Firmicutes bacterium]|nr:TlyA family RNA methyltransferase [Bacillota bacterium]